MSSKNGASANGNGYSKKGKVPPIVRQWVTKLELENVRCFGKKVEVDFCLPNSDEPCQWNVIVGDNGTGKTTVLRSIGVMALDNQHNPTFNYGYFSRNRETEARVNNFVIDKNGADLEFNLKVHDGVMSRKIYGPENIYGYGASRKVGVGKLAAGKSQTTVGTLVFDDELLPNTEQWFLTADYVDSKINDSNFFNRIRSIVLELFDGLFSDLRIDLDEYKGHVKNFVPQPSLKIETKFGWVSVDDLSLGYQTLLAWLVDVCARIIYNNPLSKNPFIESAIVLVDEIDLHLHPKFQRNLKKFLTATFPNTQFIVTAHSPLMVQGDEDSNLILLKRQGDHVVVKNDIEEVRNWSLEQLLDSEIYEHAGGFPESVKKLMKEREKLILKGKLTKAEKQKLEEIELRLPPPASYSPIEIRAMELIRKAAKEVSAKK